MDTRYEKTIIVRGTFNWLEIGVVKHGGVQKNLLYSRIPVYKEIWEAAVGEELVCARDPHNSHDRYAVAIGLGDCL